MTAIVFRTAALTRPPGSLPLRATENRRPRDTRQLSWKIDPGTLCGNFRP